jgi:hypothetical protein
MERYEYKIISIGKPKDREARMNDLGANGWELVDVYAAKMYFKRIKRSM